MFSGIFAICWQSYLSFLNRREEKEERVGLNTVRALTQLDEQLVEASKQKLEVAKKTVNDVEEKVKNENPDAG